MAARGWVHRCVRHKSLWHRLYGLILSHDVAEHLSLKSDDVTELMHKSGNWPVENGFEQPLLYVTPAVAIGKISKRAMRGCRHSQVETLSGVVFPKSGQTKRPPLVGFEADTLMRELALRVFNGVALRMPTTKPLRVSIHPFDHKLRLGKNLQQFLSVAQRSFVILRCHSK